MGAIEGVLYMIWRGIAIGIIISAPMGPVGILCVQRTLEKGRKTGFYTGVGAALSDLIYCLLTGFGLSFIEEFLERNSNIIQLIGSVVLIGFGVYLFKSNPSKNLKRPVENRKIPAGRNILNGFLFTFSNPLIIFLIIGLFARFNFLLPEIKFYHYMIGFIGVIAGALIWWWIVTYFVDKVRAHFNLRSMWLINKIIGGVIFLFAIVGIITASTGLASAAKVQSERGWRIVNNGKQDEKKTFKIEKGGDFNLKFRMRNLHNECGKSYRYITDNGVEKKVAYPSIFFSIDLGDVGYIVKIHTVDDKIDSDISLPCVQFTLIKDGKDVAVRKYVDGFNIFNGWNAYEIEVRDGLLRLRGGNRKYQDIFDKLPVAGIATNGNSDFPYVRSMDFSAGAGGHLEVANLELEYIGSEGNLEQGILSDIDSVKSYAKGSGDELEGVWGLYGYSFDDSYLKPGGDYIVGIVENKEYEGKGKNYNIIYLDGGKSGDGIWKPGMIKGRLAPTLFEGIYNVEWHDAKGEKIRKEIKAEFDLPVLKLKIPEYSSEVTFRKVD